MAKVAFPLAAALLFGLVSVSHAIQGTATLYTTYNLTNSTLTSLHFSHYFHAKIHVLVRCVGGTNAVPNPCKGGTITVKIVDHCPGCNGTLDLSKEAFAAIGNPVAGKIVIDYNQVDILLVAAMLLGLVSTSHAIEGTATFYTVYTPSACYGFQDQGTMIAAASDGLWDGGRACGRMYTVRCVRGTNAVPNPCKGGQVTVKIVDRCPSPGCTSTLDLSQEAFNVIGNPDAGRIVVDYNQV
uniref:Expansin-like EG45 domain-containing protein n=1 Tax=Leersia perrieri TaxID=77586 RepID=A0A0D9WTG4_9ORYZ